MSGLFRRTRRARAASPEPESPALTEPAHEHGPAAGAGSPLPEGEPRVATGEEMVVPAGVDLDAMIGDRPTTRRRGKLRRRLRHLRRVRELLLRDLGGLVFEIHRVGEDAPKDAQGRIVGGKLGRLAAVDAEIRELEALLGDKRPMVVREPGIGGACPACGELYGSDARYCWACGTPVAPGAARPVVEPGPTVLAHLAAASTHPHAQPGAAVPGAADPATEAAAWGPLESAEHAAAPGPAAETAPEPPTEPLAPPQHQAAAAPEPPTEPLAPPQHQAAAAPEPPAEPLAPLQHAAAEAPAPAAPVTEPATDAVREPPSEPEPPAWHRPAPAQEGPPPPPATPAAETLLAGAVPPAAEPTPERNPWQPPAFPLDEAGAGLPRPDETTEPPPLSSGDPLATPTKPDSQ